VGVGVGGEEEYSESRESNPNNEIWWVAEFSNDL